MGRVLVGISGWTYAPWRGNFYPRGLPQNRELAFASRMFGALEINGTHYSLQRPSSFRAWREATPPGFVFTVKGSRFITHMLKLRNVRAPLANFLASGLLELREKLGPILWQFPPQMRFDVGKFRAFFEMLPRDTGELARIAREHDARLKGRASLTPDAQRPVRHAVEFRHESFLCGEFVELLREFNLALVAADVAGKYPTAEDVTADFVYVRLHGSRKLYQSGYTKRELEGWAAKVRVWADGGAPKEARLIGGSAPQAGDGRDVFVFFDNTDVKLRAPVDARAMERMLGVGPTAGASVVAHELGAQRSRSRKSG